MYKEFVKHTYDQIFIENLHILKADLEGIQSIILKTQRLINNKAEKALFIYELAEKIKIEKLNEGYRQQKEYGQILMVGFESIEALYKWLTTLNNIETKETIELQNYWLKEESILLELAEYLENEQKIDSKTDFYNSFTDADFKYRVNWKGAKTLLIYLFEELVRLKFIDNNILINSYLKEHYLINGKEIENAKQSKNQTKNNKNSKPRNYTVIDDFLNNTIPKNYDR